MLKDVVMKYWLIFQVTKWSKEQVKKPEEIRKSKT